MVSVSGNYLLRMSFMSVIFLNLAPRGFASAFAWLRCSTNVVNSFNVVVGFLRLSRVFS